MSEAPLESAVDEAARLRGCLNDLVGIMALPAVWSGSDPDRIANTLLDALLEMLDLAFASVRLTHREAGSSEEIVRFAQSWDEPIRARTLRPVIDSTLGDGPPHWPVRARVFVADTDVSIATARLGLHGDIGVVVAGSERLDFPTQAERLLLELAANQATVGLQQALMLSQQRRLTSDLDERVAQRTSELHRANELLRHEIAERRRTEDALRESERESRLIVDSMPGMIALLAATGELEVGNRQLLEYFGQTIEQLRSWGTSDTIHPDDLAHVIDVFTRSIAAGSSYEIVQRFKRADGVYRWFFNRGCPLRDANGRVARWCVLLTDIDGRKRAEDALRASELNLRRAHDHLTEAQRLSQTGSVSLDLERDEHYWSEEFYRICELEEGTPVTIDRLRGIIHPEDAASCEAAIGRAMAGTEPDFYFRIVTGRGVVKHLRGVAHRIADRPVFVGAVQDVTASKVAQEALDKAGAELAHMSRVTSLSALTASVAHEVNQPLSGIMTNAGTCLRMLDSAAPDIDGARETARRTIRDANRASNVITRLRALFSKKALTLEPLDLNEATREVIALSSNDLQRNRILLRSELAEELPVVTGDRVQLQQVVLNLLRNASDAMSDVHDRPRQLLLRTAREDGGGVRVTVRDAGVGVPAASLESVFDAFHTTKSGGMGIGLFVSRSIVERHRGRLWVERNDDGPGATFAFFIPGAPENAATPARG